MMLAGMILMMGCVTGCSSLPLWMDRIYVNAYEHANGEAE